jgi:hypothetical protein
MILWTLKQRLKWREGIRKANPGIPVSEIDFLEKREEHRMEAEAWARHSTDFVPYVSREQRMRLCEEVLLSLSEGLPELRDMWDEAKAVFARERKRCRKPARRSAKATGRD